MNKDFTGFMQTFESSNTLKVVNSLQAIGEHDYKNCTPIDLEQIILGMKPNSPKAIVTICYVLSLYAKYLEDNKLYQMVQDLDRGALWLMAKQHAPKKFITNSLFRETYKDIELYEEYNSMYISTLFRCLYEGIYSDDMSVIKNLRGKDIHEDYVTLREDNGIVYDIQVSESLIKDLRKLSAVDTWSRNNRYGECKIKITGLNSDSCFKVENRKGSKEYSYRYTYYRILRNISKNYLGYNLLPLQLYVSGMMFRININLKEHGITLEDAFSSRNKDRMVNRIIAKELRRCNCDTEVRNFREIVKGHLDVFAD